MFENKPFKEGLACFLWHFESAFEKFSENLNLAFGEDFIDVSEPMSTGYASVLII